MPRLGPCVARFQHIAGRIGSADPQILLSEIRGVMTILPDPIAILDQFAVRTLVAQSLGRLLRVHGVAHDPFVARAFLSFAAAGLTREYWREDLGQLLDFSERALRMIPNDGSVDTTSHVQVQRALRLIAGGYADPALSLQRLAREVGMSPSRLSHLLTTHTGSGFVGHLHKQRVSVASRLLIESRLSVKEIAAAVGYRSATQFGRYFKRLSGVTPVSFRSA